MEESQSIQLIHASDRDIEDQDIGRVKLAMVKRERCRVKQRIQATVEDSNSEDPPPGGHDAGPCKLRDQAIELMIRMAWNGNRVSEQRKRRLDEKVGHSLHA